VRQLALRVAVVRQGGQFGSDHRWLPHRSMAAHGEPHVARQDIESSTRLTKCANWRIFLGTAAPHHRQFGSDLRSLAFGQMPAIQVEGDDEDDGVAPSPLIDDGAAALHWSLRLDALIG
jgi:hypothetical protein